MRHDTTISEPQSSLIETVPAAVSLEDSAKRTSLTNASNRIQHHNQTLFSNQRLITEGDESSAGIAAF